MDLEQDIEPHLEKVICLRYWDVRSDHADFRAIVNAIDTGGGQVCDVVGVLRQLDKAGFVIKRY